MEREMEMFPGNWSQTSMNLKTNWPDLTEEDLMAIQTNQQEIYNRLSKRYNLSRTAAEDAIKKFKEKYH